MRLPQRFRTLALGLAVPLLAIACGMDQPLPPERVAKTAQAVTSAPAPTINTFVVYVANNVTLGTGDHSLGGNIGVATSNGTTPQLVVGAQDQLDLNWTLFSPAISVGNQAIVGAVDTNSLTNSGGHVGTQSTYPSPLPPLPTLFSATPGTTNVTVPQGQTQTLSPASYGALTDNGILNLQPGTYSFTSVTLGNNAQLRALQGDSTSVQVAGTLSTGTFAQIFPLGQPANELTISVAGSDGTTAAVSLGANSQIIALLAAANGSLSFGNNVLATGAFAGLNFTAGSNVQLNFQGGFPIQTPSLSTFVAYAELSMTLGSGVHSQGGDMGVAAIGASVGTQLTVGSQDILDPQHTVFAPSVSLAANALVGDVEATTFNNNGGQFAANLPYPTSMPLMPLALAGSPTTSNITVAQGQIQTMSPGSYGTLTDNGILNLQPGTYTFSSVSLGNNAQLVAVQGGSTSIAIAGNLTTGTLSQVFPLGQAAGNLTISVAGNDGTNGSPPAASIGASTQLVALLNVPHGTLSLGNNVQATGAFAGFYIATGPNVSLQFQSGFPPAAPGQIGQQSFPSALPALQATAPLIGPVPGGNVLSLAVQVPIQNSTLLASLAQELYNPTSSQYHQFIPPAQFAASYGLTTAEYQQVVSYVQSLGLNVPQTYSNNLFFEVSGTVSAIETAFSTNMNYYQRPGGGRFFAPDRVPGLSPPIPLAWVVGLNNVNLPQNAPKLVSPPPIINNLGSGPSGSFVGYDFRNFYVPDTSLTGFGQSVALVEFADFYDTDISLYEQASTPPLPGVNLQRVPVLGGPGQQIPGETILNNEEVALDIEMAIAIAPGLSNVFVYQGPTIPPGNTMAAEHAAFDTEAMTVFNTIATDTFANGAPKSFQISSSVTGMDGMELVPALTQFMMQGQSFFISAGDEGAYVSGDPIASPPPPFDDPAVNLMTVVGGTQAVTGQGTTTACLVESTWNNASEYPAGAGGGGICSPNATALSPNVNSVIVFIPASAGVTSPGFWFSALASSGASGNNASNQYRNIPDVAALADNIYTVADNGFGSGTGGTSAAAPMWAGFAALANEQGPGFGLGLANFALYRIGQGPNYRTDFRDIDDFSTNNESSTNSAHFEAIPGYDLATGWGSPRLGLLTDLSGTSSVLPFNTYNDIMFTIGTDGDNLRCTSIAVASLLDASGNDMQDITLHGQGQSSWDAGSSHSVGPTALTSPAPIARNTIASIKITMYQTGDTCQGGTQRDFWDVGSVFVQLSNSSSSVTATILDLVGSPDLVQLGATDPSTVTFTTIFSCQ